MSLAYFAPFVTLPVIITGPGYYVTRSGERVHVSRVSHRHDFGCAGIYPSGQYENWHKSGRLYAGRECANDIVCTAEAAEVAKMLDDDDDYFALRDARDESRFHDVE